MFVWLTGGVRLINRWCLFDWQVMFVWLTGDVSLIDSWCLFDWQVGCYDKHDYSFSNFTTFAGRSFVGLGCLLTGAKVTTAKTVKIGQNWGFPVDARSNPTVTVIFLQAMELKEIGPPGNSVTGKLVLLTVVNPEFPGNWAPTPVFWANTIIIDRNEVVAKVIFLHLSVIHSVYRGVCLSACWDNTPPEQTPPGADTPLEQTTTGADSPPEADTPPGSRLQHTVYERPVRILLESILVEQLFAKSLGEIERNLIEKGCAGIPGAPWIRPWIRQCFCTCRTTRSWWASQRWAIMWTWIRRTLMCRKWRQTRRRVALGQTCTRAGRDNPPRVLSSPGARLSART